MTKIKKTILILSGLTVIALISGYIYLGVYRPAKVLSPPQNGLYQNYLDQEGGEDISSEKFFKEKTLHFIAKHRIAKGKYGFIKKIEIKKKSGIEINEKLSDGKPEDLVFGVYRDSKCNDVIEKLQGEDLTSGLDVKLEKGTYYIGIYTTDITATYKIPVLVDCCYLYPKVALKENKKIYLFYGDKNQVNTLTIVAPKTGRIAIGGTYREHASTTLKNENGKNAVNLGKKVLMQEVKKHHFDTRANGVYIEPVFKVEKGKKYKLIIESSEEKHPKLPYLEYRYLDKDQKIKDLITIS